MLFRSRVYVLFHAPKISLKDAVNVLRRRGLSVEISGDRLQILEDDQPVFGVALVTGKEVEQTATYLGHGTEFANQLSQSDSRFEIGFDDNKRIQDNGKTLAEVRSALQELTHGVAYNTWDKALAGAK